jgi:hypothetical protein
MWRRTCTLAVVLTLGVSNESSAETQLGYQLGLVQSVGTTATNNQLVLAGQGAEPPVVALQGLQLTTAVTGNLTLDVMTRALSHGFLLGTRFSQLFPVGAPDTAQAQLRQPQSQFDAAASYLARLERATYGLGFRAAYNFALNGRLGTAQDGAVQGGGAGNTLPGVQAGAFVVNSQIHSVVSELQWQLRQRTWDLNLIGRYQLQLNGIFSLANGPVGGQNVPGAAGTNLGAFVQSDAHLPGASLNFRHRVGTRGMIEFEALSDYTLPIPSQDIVVVDGINTTITVAQPVLPESWTSVGRLRYDHRLQLNRRIGVELASTVSFRVPTDLNGFPLLGESLRADVLAPTAQAFYFDRIQALDLFVSASAGGGVPFLFQPPIGFPQDPDTFDVFRGDVEPVFRLALRRRFEPIDVTAALFRNIAVGALGASAVVNEAVTLQVQYAFEAFQERMLASAGFNANRTRGAGLQAVADAGAVNNLAINAARANNNDGIGANAALLAPIWGSGPYSIDASVNYNFNWFDSDPDGLLLIDPNNPGAGTIPPTATHTVLFVVRLLWGRGPLQEITQAGGFVNGDELDAFSRDPASGSPLVSSQLSNFGAPIFSDTLGERPGEPVVERRSRQAEAEKRTVEARSDEARGRSDIVRGSTTVQQEEVETLERLEKEQEEQRTRRSRSFPEVPEDAGESEGSSDTSSDPPNNPQP